MSKALSSRQKNRSSRQNNPLKCLSIADLCHNVDNNHRRSVKKVSPGVGPSPFAEQGYRVIVALAKQPENVRATHFEECTPGNWIPNIQDSENTFCVQKNEIVFRVIDPTENGSRVKEIKAGTPMMRIQSSTTNLKNDVEIEVVGIAMNPSASRGKAGSTQDPAATVQIGGTASVPHASEYRVRIGDRMYGMKQAFTEPVVGDPSGRSGYTTCCPMKGIHREKFLLQTVPLGPMSIDQMIKSQLFDVDTKVDALLYDRPNHKSEAPSQQQVKLLLEDVDSSLRHEPQAQVPEFIPFLKLHMITRFIRYGESLALEVDGNDQDVWKEFAASLCQLLAQLLQDYYQRQQKKVPWYVSTLNWKTKLPFVLDYTYKKEDAWKPMPNRTKRPVSHMHQLLTASDHVTREIPVNINQTMAKLFIGTALTGAEPTYPFDVDIKRY